MGQNTSILYLSTYFEDQISQYLKPNGYFMSGSGSVIICTGSVPFILAFETDIENNRKQTLQDGCCVFSELGCGWDHVLCLKKLHQTLIDVSACSQRAAWCQPTLNLGWNQNAKNSYMDSKLYPLTKMRFQYTIILDYTRFLAIIIIKI